MKPAANKTHNEVKVKVTLDELSIKYASKITASEITKSIGHSNYWSASCADNANNKFQRTAKRRR